MDDRCQICTFPFTQEEWEHRHSDFDGGDIHEDCCDREGPCSHPDPTAECPV
ncbi:MAG TPA: hypothetical protein VGK43_04450 [Solirubrobacterales bacterium]